MVEQLTADQQVIGSNPMVDCVDHTIFIFAANFVLALPAISGVFIVDTTCRIQLCTARHRARKYLQVAFPLCVSALLQICSLPASCQGIQEVETAI